MTETQLLEILTQALMQNAPQAYRQMKSAGTLKEFLSNLAGVTLEAISEARQAAISAIVTQGSPQYEANPLKRAQQINMAEKSAEEVALSQAMETIAALLPESATTTESPPAS